MSDSSSLLTIDQRLELAQVTRSEFVNAIVHLDRGELGEAGLIRLRTGRLS